MIDDLQVWSVAFNPGQDLLEDTLHMLRVVTHHHAGNASSSMLIVGADFSS